MVAPGSSPPPHPPTVDRSTSHCPASTGSFLRARSQTQDGVRRGTKPAPWYGVGGNNPLLLQRLHDRVDMLVQPPLAADGGMKILPSLGSPRESCKDRIPQWLKVRFGLDQELLVGDCLSVE